MSTTERLICNNCYSEHQSGPLWINFDCGRNLHIICDNCLAKCGTHFSCKQCQQQRNEDCTHQIRGDPFAQLSDIEINALCGYPPHLIQKIANKALDFWTKQIDLKCKYVKSKLFKTERDKNELSEYYESEKIRFEKECKQKERIQSEKYKKLKNAAIKYKGGYIKMSTNFKKLQKEQNEKERQFKNMKTKYTELLRQSNKRKRSHSSIDSISSFDSAQSAHSRKKQKTKHVLNGNVNYSIIEHRIPTKQRRLSQPLPFNHRIQKKRRQSIGHLAVDPLPNIPKKRAMMRANQRIMSPMSHGTISIAQK